jgi:hypothetical protein
MYTMNFTCIYGNITARELVRHHSDSDSIMHVEPAAGRSVAEVAFYLTPCIHAQTLQGLIKLLMKKHLDPE